MNLLHTPVPPGRNARLVAPGGPWPGTVASTNAPGPCWWWCARAGGWGEACHKAVAFAHASSPELTASNTPETAAVSEAGLTWRRPAASIHPPLWPNGQGACLRSRRFTVRVRAVVPFWLYPTVAFCLLSWPGPTKPPDHTALSQIRAVAVSLPARPPPAPRSPCEGPSRAAGPHRQPVS